MKFDQACDDRETALDLELKEIQNISKKYKFSQNVSTPKCTHLNWILAPRSHPTPCRLRHNKLKKVNAKLLKKYWLNRGKLLIKISFILRSEDPLKMSVKSCLERQKNALRSVSKVYNDQLKNISEFLLIISSTKKKHSLQSVSKISFMRISCQMNRLKCSSVCATSQLLWESSLSWKNKAANKGGVSRCKIKVFLSFSMNQPPIKTQANNFT